MKNFFRSLRYLRPYRFRLGVSILCVILIAVLWSGGLGMLLPGMKILISPEGLHGWAYNELIAGQMGADVIQRRVPAGTEVWGRQVSEVVDVVSVADDGEAKRQGIAASDWIVGLADARGSVTILRADAMARTLAGVKSGQEIRLAVYRPGRDRPHTVDVTMGQAGWGARLLGWIAGAIDEPPNKAGRFNMFFWLLAIGVGMTLLRDLLRFCQEYLVQSAVFRGMLDLRCDNYNVALRLPVTFFAEHGTSDTMSRFVSDTDELVRGQVTLFGKTLVEPAKAIGSIVMAMLFSWQLTLAAMIAGPPAFILIRKFGKRMKRASRKALESRSGMLAVLDETLVGIRVVKAYTMEAAERKRFFRVNRELLKQQRRMAAIDSATAPTIEALGVTAGMLAAGAAGYLVFHDRMDTDVFMAWMACLAAMFDPIRKLAKVATRFQRAEAAAARVFELNDREVETSPPHAAALGRHSRDIEFRDVTFRYPGAADDALRNVNLTIQAGQSVAIVGPNGCGKTTLISLVPLLLRPSRGQIRIDGLNVEEVSLRSLRRQIGLVTQETVLFNATIGENIAYGLRRPSQAAVLDASKKAFVDEFVRELPDGYDTMVGEHGATLSGGQKQRIAIARAILRDPTILIFDEATSQVDADSQRRIHEAMAEFVQGRTTLMIAHQFSTVQSADLIVVMDDGRIIDTGSHAELIESCQLYRHLHETQFGRRE